MVNYGMTSCNSPVPLARRGKCGKYWIDEEVKFCKDVSREDVKVWWFGQYHPGGYGSVVGFLCSESDGNWWKIGRFASCD